MQFAYHAILAATHNRSTWDVHAGEIALRKIVTESAQTAWIEIVHVCSVRVPSSICASFGARSVLQQQSDSTSRNEFS